MTDTTPTTPETDWDDESDVAPITIGSHVRFFNGPVMIVTDLDPESGQVLCCWWHKHELHTSYFPESLCIHAMTPITEPESETLVE